MSEGPSLSRAQVIWRGMLLILSIAAPLIAILICRTIASYDVQAQIISTRTVCGVIVGQLIGLRRGTLLSLILGPVCGIAAGVIDIKVFVWLFESLQWTISTAGLVPAWGLVIGLLVASYYRIGWKFLAVLSIIVAADWVARWYWDVAIDKGWLDLKTSQLRIAEGVTYVPTAFLSVALTMAKK